jgi:hypothetical protein
LDCGGKAEIRTTAKTYRFAVALRHRYSIGATPAKRPDAALAVLVLVY